MRRLSIFHVIAALAVLIFAFAKRFMAWLRPIASAFWARVRTWYTGLTPSRQKVARLTAMGVPIALAFWLLISLGNRALTTDEVTSQPPMTGSGSSISLPGSEIPGNPPSSTVAPTPTQKKFAPYTVKRGEFIIGIAKAQGVPWESVIVANERELAERAVERCGKLGESYTKRPGRRGHYCNSLVVVGGKPMVSANSLLPGDVLQIPSVTAPVAIQNAITNVKGNRIVVVIDDTGSMTDDRERVSSWYLQAVKNSGKQIVRVIMYADGFVRELDAGNVVFLSSGGLENTRGALERAATYTPDAIVLLTDEPGDDWNSFRGLHLPPVIAHSLNWSADENLVYVARVTGGSFLSSHAGPIGLATINPTP